MTVPMRAMVLIAMGSLSAGCGDGGRSDDTRPDAADGVCSAAALRCDGECVDPLTDSRFCGATATCDGANDGVACGDDEACDGGECVLDCAPGLVACGGACINPANSAEHCGASGDCTGDAAGDVCSEGELCDGLGTCAATCAAGFEDCGGVCTDLMTDAASCGACGNTCDNVACSSGLCCPDGFRGCGEQCLELDSDLANCGECGNVCGNSQACGSGDCLCPPGRTDCGGGDDCVSLETDPAHCGACGVPCGAGQQCVWGVCSDDGTSYVTGFSTDECVVTDVDGVIGDDRGGIAANASSVYITGDGATASYDLDFTEPGVPFGSGVSDALFTDLSTGDVYTLVDAGGPIGRVENTVTLTGLGPIDPSTGVVAYTLPLSAPITVDASSGGWAMFPGRGVLHLLTNDGAADDVLYTIQLLSGRVATRSLTTRPCVYPSENWASWGIAEVIGGVDQLTYRDCDSQTLVRYDVATENVTVVGEINGLSDLASFTVVPSLHRWFFHYEGSGFAGGSSETLGHCPLSWCAGAGCL